MSSTYIPKRALFVYAHPDDIEFGVAGTAAYWAQNGSEVRYVLLTDGNIGSHDPDMTKEKLAEIRREEQRESARICGVKDVVFLGYPDGMLQPTLELRRDIVREIRRWKANVIVTGDPQMLFPRDTYINHPDHRAAAQATIDACFPAPESPLIFPELLEEGHEPHKPNYVYISFTSRTPNIFIDTSSTIDTKVKALLAHKSQMKDWDPTERIKGWAAETGKRVGLPFAEAFFRITLKEDEPDKEEA